MSKAVSNPAKNGNDRQKSCKYLNEIALCNALEMAKEVIS